MTEEPRRLRDDPSFFAETGCDLRAEAEAFAGPAPDLSALRQRVLDDAAKAVARAAARRLVCRVAAGALGGAVVALWFAWPGAPWPPPTEPAPSRTEVTPLPPLTVAPPVPSRVSPLAPKRVAPPSAGVAPVAAISPPPVATPPVATTVAAVVTATPDLPPGAAVPSAPRVVSDLPDQLAAFRRAEAALAAGDPARARLGFTDYLRRWPEGQLVPEARLGMLQAAVTAGESDTVVELAAGLLADPTLATRHASLAAIRAEALAELGRCDEARAQAEGLDRAVRARVRLACR